MSKENVLITGGAGFIGANFVKSLRSKPDKLKNYNFVVLDALTYAGNIENIKPEIRDSIVEFCHEDIRDISALKKIFNKYEFSCVVNFAAESHVDRSILDAGKFFETNVLGVNNLLSLSREVFEKGQEILFLQVSTDEVYGSLGINDPAFRETNSLKPNSPYSSSKASADLIVRSYYKTYGLPVITTRCSNNYGPYQYPEKLIPLMTLNALKRKPLPVYGDGSNVRDWIHVHDHVEGIWRAMELGRFGEVYNFGGNSEVTNIDMVKMILNKLGRDHSLIQFVDDRLGHDFRYAVDWQKAMRELEWSPSYTFDRGLSQTIEWYTTNQGWLKGGSC